MDFVQFKTLVAEKAAQMGITEYELYYETSESTTVGAFAHEINQFSSAIAGGVCFRCIVNGKMGYASTEALNEAEAAAIVARAADNAATLETDDPVFLGEGGQKYESLDLKPYDLPDTQTLIDKVLATQEAIYAADAMVVDGCSTQGVSERSEIAIFNSKGLDLSYVNRISALIVASVVSNGEEMANDHQIKLGELSKLDSAALAGEATRRAIAKLGGEVAPTGTCPVVFSPEAMADLLQTFSSVFSSESAQKGLSRLADSEGQIIASEAVTLVDDPFHPENPMPIPFDAEGSPTHCKKVVEKGILNTLLYNLKTAALAGKKTTGNASKSGYNSTVAVRPFTMYLAPGGYSEEELLKKAGSGVYINFLGGLHAGANAVSGDFSLQSAGYLIEDGRKTTPVKSFTVAGNFYDLLKNITAAADNVELPSALGMTAFGAPSVLVENLSIAGK